MPSFSPSLIYAVYHGELTSLAGYSYRLCPASQDLTESCFSQTALDFVGNSSLRWGGVGGVQLFFNSTALGWETTHGTLPLGSMWRKCPLPRGPARGGHDWGWQDFGASFEPVCAESAECLKPEGDAPLGACMCSGQGAPVNPIGAEIVDRVMIPADLAPGKW